MSDIKFNTNMTKDDVDFDTWMKIANRACINRCGMHLADLPDWGFRDAYDEGVSAKDAAIATITSARNG